jgi:hypothetical protein
MRPLLFVALLLAAVPATAQWVPVIEGEETVFYVDPASIEKDRHYRRVWQLEDLKDSDEDGYCSYTQQVEYDCSSGRFRSLRVKAFRGQMADIGAGCIEKDICVAPRQDAGFDAETGERRSTTAQWSEIAPDTPNAHILKFICAR